MCRGFSIEQPQCVWADDEQCGYNLPDSWVDCKGYDNCNLYRKRSEMEKVKIIEGVGQDAEIITNDKGGKQSKAPMAMHLVDPKFLEDYVIDKIHELTYQGMDGASTCDKQDEEKVDIYTAIQHIAQYMQDGSAKLYLLVAADDLCEGEEQIVRMAKVLQYGASRYKANNWRLIPEEEHINHALIHLLAAVMGDTQDDHIDHALCRLMMAYATEKSEGFEYGEYVA